MAKQNDKQPKNKSKKNGQDQKQTGRRNKYAKYAARKAEEKLRAAQLLQAQEMARLEQLTAPGSPNVDIPEPAPFKLSIVEEPKRERSPSMSVAMENARYQPTSANIARVSEAPEPPKPVIMRARVIKIFGIGIGETAFIATPVDPELAKKGTIFGASYHGREVFTRGSEIRFSREMRCAPPAKVGIEVVTWSVPSERGGYRAVRWTYADLWDAARLESVPAMVRSLALIAALA